MLTDSERHDMSIAHYDKWIPHVKRLHVNFDNSDKINRIVASIKGGDRHLNDIRLWEWDTYHIWYYSKSRHIATWSLSDTVCTAKTAALIAGIKRITGKEPQTGKDIVELFEYITSNDIKHYVVMNDKQRKNGKINKLIFECDTHHDAMIVMDNARKRGDMTRITYKGTDKPVYNSRRYELEYKNKYENPYWYNPEAEY